MSFGKGSNQNTTTTTQTPDPAAMAAYRGLLNRAAGVANLPYQAYGGEGVAPINAQQYAGIGNINQNAGFALPYIQQATQYANQAAQPITGAQIAGFQSPYTQQVVNATEAQFNNQNAQQQQQVLGNAIAQGALGGDRTAVAQANLAGQQQMAEAPVIAGLYNQGYQNAQQMALAQQQAMAQGAYSLGNLGVAGQNAALTGANAQVGAGSLEQQTQNALDQYLYGQFMQGQAFPYQQAQWLAGIDTGVGSQMGGTSTTTGPPPNPWNTAAGLGVAALGAMAPSKSASGGRIRGFAPGGMVSPTMAPAMGGAPQANPMAGFAGNPTLQRVGDAMQSGFGNMMQRIDSNPRLAGLMSEFQKYMPQWGGWGGQSGPQAGFGPMMGRPGFDDGGEVSGFGGVPYGGAGGYIPGAFQGQHGNTMPKPPGVPSSGGSSGAGGIPGLNANALGAAGKGLGALGEGLGNLGSSAMTGLGELAPEFAADMGEALPFLAALAFKRGGGVKRAGFAPGGDVDLSNAYPLGDIDPNDASTNNFGFNFNPVRTDANTAYPEPVADVPMPRSRPTLGDVTAPSDNGIYMPVPREPEPTPIVGAARVGPPEEEKQSGLFGGWGLSDAARTGLITAGLGMMASRSPNLWNAIGEGGLAGVSAYSGEKKQAASIEEARKRLEQHHEEVEQRIKAETQRHSDAETARQDRLQQQRISLMKPMVIDKDPYGQPVYGRMSEKGELLNLDGTPYSAEQRTKAAANANLKGDEYIKTLPESEANQIRQAGQYMGAIPSVNSRSPQARKLRDDIFQAYPDIDERMYGAQSAAVRKFWSGPDSDTTRAQNTAIAHLDTLQKAAAALKNGDTQVANKLLNWIGQQTGKPGPTDFNAVRDIVLDEVVKAVVGSRAGVTEREEAHTRVGREFSQGQFDSVADRYKDLMAGQVRSMRQKFTATTGLHPEVFDRFLLPETKEQLDRHGASGEVAAGTTVPAVQGQDKAALDWANAHPDDPRSAAIKKKLGVQ